MKKLLLTLTLISILLPAQAGYRTSPNQNPTQTKSSNFQVSAWLPTSWDISAAQLSWNQNNYLIDEINPIWFKMCINDQNQITQNLGAGNPNWLQKFHQAGVKIIPLVSNSSNNTCLSWILKNKTERQKHISDLISLVDQFDFDGLDIDYEKVKASDKDLFTIFISELSSKLHAKNKILSIAVHPKKSDSENWSGPGGQDWAKLAPLVDQFKIMAYDAHWLSGQPGPIAPLPWIRQILEYAKTKISPEKTWLGVPFYSYDWPVDQNGNRVPGAYSRSHQKITQDLCLKYDCQKTWLPNEGTTLIKYQSKYDNHPHQIFYENHKSLSPKLDLVSEFGLAGISIWKLGNEDPQNWQIISQKQNKTTHSKIFQDCQNTSEICQAANSLFSQNILVGDGKNFHPNLPLSRAQLLKIAFAANQIIPTQIAQDQFLDVKSDSWFHPFVNHAKTQNWISGYPDQTFRPFKEISKSESLKIILEIGGFHPQISDSDWAAPFWQKAQSQNLINPNWLQSQNQSLTRGEAALILSRFLDLD